LSRALRVGLTGKFGSGKSTVSRVFRTHGIAVIDSDQLAKDLMTSDETLKQQLIAILGEDAYAEGSLNKAFIAERIFSDPQARVNVESVVHPAVFRSLQRSFEEAMPGEIIAVESALIFQTFLWREFDYIVLVDANEENVIGRSNAAGKFSEETVRARLQEQGYGQDYVNAADFTISNNDTEQSLVSRATMIALMIKALAKQDLPAMPLRMKQEDEDEEEESPAEEHKNDTIH
jgi:dephospho-CoA kinase